MTMRVFGRGLALAAVIALATPVLVATTAQAQVNVVLGGAATGEAEVRDAALVETAMAAFQRRGYAGMRPHLRGLRAALDGAPGTYATIEAVSANDWIVRSNNDEDALMLSLLVSAMAQQGAPTGPVTITARPNVYPLIALLLGSEAVERGAMDEAIGYLDQGLALQPANASLAAERMGAMQAKGQMVEALAFGDAVLAQDDMPPLSEGLGVLHRRRGFSLIELGRLDEARAAFNESLEADPGNSTALGELAYIDGLEAGQAPVPGIANAPKGDPAPRPDSGDGGRPTG